MSILKLIAPRKNAIAAGVSVAVCAALFASAAQAGNTIPLSGIAGAVCSINVTPDAAATSLPITTAGSQNVTVGTVLQSCNKPAGYTLSITSGNCVASPTGAKLIELGGSQLPFSVNATNPTTGGSAATVTGLLSSTCTSQNVRDVTGVAITGESSTLSVLFTGSATLPPGTYQDTLTLGLTTK